MAEPIVSQYQVGDCIMQGRIADLGDDGQDALILAGTVRFVSPFRGRLKQVSVVMDGALSTGSPTGLDVTFGSETPIDETYSRLILPAVLPAGQAVLFDFGQMFPGNHFEAGVMIRIRSNGLTVQTPIATVQIILGRL